MFFNPYTVAQVPDILYHLLKYVSIRCFDSKIIKRVNMFNIGENYYYVP
jgi:hypothetical protein